MSRKEACDILRQRSQSSGHFGVPNSPGHLTNSGTSLQVRTESLDVIPGMVKNIKLFLHPETKLILLAVAYIIPLQSTRILSKVTSMSGTTNPPPRITPVDYFLINRKNHSRFLNYLLRPPRSPSPSGNPSLSREQSHLLPPAFSTLLRLSHPPFPSHSSSRRIHEKTAPMAATSARDSSHIWKLTEPSG